MMKVSLPHAEKIADYLVGFARVGNRSIGGHSNIL